MLHNEPDILSLLRKIQESSTEDVDEERGSFKEGDRVIYEMFGSGLTNSDLIKMLGVNEHAARLNHNESTAKVVEAIGEEVARYSIVFDDGFTINDVATSELKAIKEDVKSDLVDIANTKLGWAVAEQLKAILDNPTVYGIEDAQLNVNAVRLIYRFLKGRSEEEAIEAASAIEEWVEEDFGPPDVLEFKTNEQKLSTNDVKELFVSIDKAFAKHLTGLTNSKKEVVKRGLEAGLELSDKGKEILGESKTNEGEWPEDTVVKGILRRAGFTEDDFHINIGGEVVPYDEDNGPKMAKALNASPRLPFGKEAYYDEKDNRVVLVKKESSESKTNEAEDATQTMRPQEKPDINAEDFHMEDYSEEDLNKPEAKVKSKSVDAGDAIRQVKDDELEQKPDKVVSPKKESKITEEDVFTKHQLKIAKDTLKMSDAMVSTMGGMSKEEAREFLKKQGWSDKKIAALEESKLQEQKDVLVKITGGEDTGKSGVVSHWIKGLGYQTVHLEGKKKDISCDYLSVSGKSAEEFDKEISTTLESKLQEEETELSLSRVGLKKISDDKLKELHDNSLRSYNYWKKAKEPEKALLAAGAIEKYEDEMVARGMISDAERSEDIYFRVKKESKLSLVKKEKPFWLCNECCTTFRSSEGICEKCESKNVERITSEFRRDIQVGDRVGIKDQPDLGFGTVQGVDFASGKAKVEWDDTGDRTDEDLENLTKRTTKRSVYSEKVDSKKEKWIKAVLSNDEVSTDDELVSYFMEEGNLSREEAEKWVSERQKYLKQIESKEVNEERDNLTINGENLVIHGRSPDLKNLDVEELKKFMETEPLYVITIHVTNYSATLLSNGYDELEATEKVVSLEEMEDVLSVDKVDTVGEGKTNEEKGEVSFLKDIYIVKFKLNGLEKETRVLDFSRDEAKRHAIRLFPGAEILSVEKIKESKLQEKFYLVVTPDDEGGWQVLHNIWPHTKHGGGQVLKSGFDTKEEAIKWAENKDWPEEIVVDEVSPGQRYATFTGKEKESKLHETVQELVGEVPGIDIIDQNLLKKAIEKEIIPNQFPELEVMIDELSAAGVAEELGVKDIDDVDLGDIDAVYLKYILLPKAKKELVAKEGVVDEKKIRFSTNKTQYGSDTWKAMKKDMKDAGVSWEKDLTTGHPAKSDEEIAVLVSRGSADKFQKISDGFNAGFKKVPREKFKGETKTNEQIEDLDVEAMDDDELSMLWRETKHLKGYYKEGTPSFRLIVQQEQAIENELKKRGIMQESKFTEQHHPYFGIGMEVSVGDKDSSYYLAKGCVMSANPDEKVLVELDDGQRIKFDAFQLRKLKSESKLEEESEDWDLTFKYAHDQIWQNPMLDREGNPFIWARHPITGKKIRVFTDHQEKWVKKFGGVPVRAKVEESKLQEQEEVSAQEIFDEYMKLYKDERKAAEATLDIMTGGVFAAAESDSREKMISKALAKWGGKKESKLQEQIGSTDDFLKAWKAGGMYSRGEFAPFSEDDIVSAIKGYWSEVEYPVDDRNEFLLKLMPKVSGKYRDDLSSFIDDISELKEQEKDIFTPIAKGISDKADADKLAREKGGQVIADEENKGKFAVIVKEE